MVQAEKTIAQKIKELEMATEWFYSDDFKLEEAAPRYEAAIKLAKEVEADLNQLRNKIEVIEKDFTKD